MSITVITEKATIQGDVFGEDNLNVAGTIHGSVDIAGRLSVEVTGIVGGTADVHEAWIAGTIDGDIRATSLIHVTETGRVGGEIIAPRIIVDPGAVIRHNEYANQVLEQESEETPIVDVESQPPQRIQQVEAVRPQIRSKPLRRRVVVKKRVRK